MNGGTNFKSIVPDLKKFISGLPLVAHNAPFDLKFLYVCGLSSVESCDAYDTLQLSRSIIKDCDGENSTAINYQMYVKSCLFISMMHIVQQLMHLQQDYCLLN